MCQVMTAKCRRHGHVTLPSHLFVHSFVHSFIYSFIHLVHSFILACVHCMFICHTYPVICIIHHVHTCICLLYTLCESKLLAHSITSFDQTNIKLSILERLARFVRIKSCFHKDGTTGRMSQVAMM